MVGCDWSLSQSKKRCVVALQSSSNLELSKTGGMATGKGELHSGLQCSLYCCCDIILSMSLEGEV